MVKRKKTLLKIWCTIWMILFWLWLLYSDREQCPKRKWVTKCRTMNIAWVINGNLNLYFFYTVNLNIEYNKSASKPLIHRLNAIEWFSQYVLTCATELISNRILYVDFCHIRKRFHRFFSFCLNLFNCCGPKKRPQINWNLSKIIYFGSICLNQRTCEDYRL